MAASFLNVHNWNEPISQTENEQGLLEHYWTGGKSKYHQPIYHSIGLGCQENDCEMNDSSSVLYKQLRRDGF